MCIYFLSIISLLVIYNYLCFILFHTHIPDKFIQIQWIKQNFTMVKVDLFHYCPFVLCLWTCRIRIHFVRFRSVSVRWRFSRCEGQTTFVQGVYAWYESPRRLVAKVLSETEENNLHICLLNCRVNQQVKKLSNVEKRRDLAVLTRRTFMLFWKRFSWTHVPFTGATYAPVLDWWRLLWFVNALLDQIT